MLHTSRYLLVFTLLVTGLFGIAQQVNATVLWWGREIPYTKLDVYIQTAKLVVQQLDDDVQIDTNYVRHIKLELLTQLKKLVAKLPKSKYSGDRVTANQLIAELTAELANISVVKNYHITGNVSELDAYTNWLNVVIYYNKQEKSVEEIKKIITDRYTTLIKLNDNLLSSRSLSYRTAQLITIQFITTALVTTEHSPRIKRGLTIQKIWQRPTEAEKRQATQ